MPVVINEFEVMPQTSSQEKPSAGKNEGGKGSEKSEMTDQEIKKMLEHRAERLERVAAH